MKKSRNKTKQQTFTEQAKMDLILFEHKHRLKDWHYSKYKSNHEEMSGWIRHLEDINAGLATSLKASAENLDEMYALNVRLKDEIRILTWKYSEREKEINKISESFDKAQKTIMKLAGIPEHPR